MIFVKVFTNTKSMSCGSCFFLPFFQWGFIAKTEGRSSLWKGKRGKEGEEKMQENGICMFRKWVCIFIFVDWTTIPFKRNNLWQSFASEPYHMISSPIGLYFPHNWNCVYLFVYLFVYKMANRRQRYWRIASMWPWIFPHPLPDPGEDLRRYEWHGQKLVCNLTRFDCCTLLHHCLKNYTTLCNIWTYQHFG